MRDGIRKDGKGWEANATIKGKRVYRTFSTKTEARIWRAQQIADASRGEWVAPSQRTVGEIIDLWLSMRQSYISPKTYENYKGFLKHCPDRTVQLDRLDAITVEMWMLEIDKKVGRATANKFVKTLRSAMRWAVTRKLIISDPTDGVELLPSTTKEKEPLTREELADALTRLDGLYRDVVIALAFTGMRIGDCLALTVADVDVLKARVHIGNEKSGRKGHWVPLVGPAREVILRRAAESDGILFPTSKQTIRYHLLRATEHLGRTVSPHMLRHTFATWALQSGAPITSVSRWLGHANVTETLNTYSHLMPDDFDAVASVIEAAWGQDDAERKAL